jgi:hypothetical protein
LVVLADRSICYHLESPSSDRTQWLPVLITGSEIFPQHTHPFSVQSTLPTTLDQSGNGGGVIVVIVLCYVLSCCDAQCLQKTTVRRCRGHSHSGLHGRPGQAARRSRFSRPLGTAQAGWRLPSEDLECDPGPARQSMSR